MKIIGISQCYDENSILEEMLKFPTPLAPTKIHRSFPIHVLCYCSVVLQALITDIVLMYPKFLNCLLCTAICFSTLLLDFKCMYLSIFTNKL